MTFHWGVIRNKESGTGRIKFKQYRIPKNKDTSLTVQTCQGQERITWLLSLFGLRHSRTPLTAKHESTRSAGRELKLQKLRDSSHSLLFHNTNQNNIQKLNSRLENIQVQYHYHSTTFQIPFTRQISHHGSWRSKPSQGSLQGQGRGFRHLRWKRSYRLRVEERQDCSIGTSCRCIQDLRHPQVSILLLWTPSLTRSTQSHHRLKHGRLTFNNIRHGAQGQLNTASKATLENEFETTKEEEIIKVILEKGSVQESEVSLLLRFHFPAFVKKSNHTTTPTSYATRKTVSTTTIKRINYADILYLLGWWTTRQQER